MNATFMTPLLPAPSTDSMEIFSPQEGGVTPTTRLLIQVVFDPIDAGSARTVKIGYRQLDGTAAEETFHQNKAPTILAIPAQGPVTVNSIDDGVNGYVVISVADS